MANIFEGLNLFSFVIEDHPGNIPGMVKNGVVGRHKITRSQKLTLSTPGSIELTLKAPRKNASENVVC